MPRDLLARQSLFQRQWALQAVADARAMILGGGIRADCLECRGIGGPRINSRSPSDGAQESGLLGLLASLWR